MKIFAKASLLAIALLVGNADAMTFSAPKHEAYDALSWINRGGGETRIYADGEITSSTAMDFERFVKANKPSCMPPNRDPPGELNSTVAEVICSPARPGNQLSL